MSNRHGFSLSLLVVIGGVLFILLLALSHYSSQEIRMVKKLIARRKAEAAAISGMNWVVARLKQPQAGRWYQPPRTRTGSGGAGTTWLWEHRVTPALFPAESGMSVEISLDE
ncbi:MAG TPA: hypothetical protein PKO06_20255, partial [Candidatus Ozemobacteraceae bacterium]|nr:hypothetical protein [Candidatus Ozemobacteraceae bacterium]